MPPDPLQGPPTELELSSASTRTIDQVRNRLVRIAAYGHNQDMDIEEFEKARLERDPRYDGRFFIGVKTTGIYCRPICPAPLPKACNVRFFLSAAAAGEAGFRPCLRCRPEAAPGSPAWMGTSTSVSRALKLIAGGALDEGTVEDLAERLGIGSRHLRRLFLHHLGATPVAVAQTRRLHLAKRLIDETDLPMTQVALASGFSSIRRFNATFVNTYGRSPTQLRGAALKRRKRLPDGAPIELVQQMVPEKRLREIIPALQENYELHLR